LPGALKSRANGARSCTLALPRTLRAHSGYLKTQMAHSGYLKTQIELVAKVGEPNYLQSQIGGAGS
jgi:hypothetical protein